jgi:hypothetical protein
MTPNQEDYLRRKQEALRPKHPLASLFLWLAITAYLVWIGFFSAGIFRDGWITNQVIWSGVRIPVPPTLVHREEFPKIYWGLMFFYGSVGLGGVVGGSAGFIATIRSYKKGAVERAKVVASNQLPDPAPAPGTPSARQKSSHG